VALTDSRVTFRYDGVDGKRRRTHVVFGEDATVEAVQPDDIPELGGCVRFHWSWPLAAGEERDLEWVVWSSELEAVADRAAPPTEAPRVLFPNPPLVSADEGTAAYHAWVRSTTSVATDHELFNRTINRSIADLRLLVNDGPTDGERYVAAGIPWFATLFGRDSIITALQMLAFRPQIAVETLDVLASLQATEVDEFRDAEPGKILHELRVGETARAGELPHSPYYGSVDSTPLWLILLGATYDWTGDRSLVDRLWPNALAALRWIDEWGDRDGDGFVEYERRSPRGLLNQGWKDSGDAIRDRRGRQARAPIALAEVQGYVYDAKLRMGDVYEVLGRPADARRLRRQADELFERVNESMWWEEEGTYYLGLDGQKRPIRSVASNAGHLLQSGIVPPERAGRVVERLMADDMWSGWGIRTLSSDHPAYNPFSYHTGTVWPHDNAMIAGGFRRYGFDGEAARVAKGMFDAAERLLAFRLPELFAGLPRHEASFPVLYLGANVPQAWAAGSIFRLIAILCGIHALTDGDGSRIYVNPALPEWMPELTIRNLRAGQGSLDIALRDGTIEVLSNSTDFEIIHGPAPRLGRTGSDRR
jgi:glycogen debranching enzyme